MPNFGSVPNIRVGQIFTNRRAALHDADIHRGLMNGIAPQGASIVLSEGYIDDEDAGDVIIYTGEGGRDPNSGRQISNQSFTGGNYNLAHNASLGNPIRVTRINLITIEN
ncbi:YDG/SRA domain-containing protein [Chloroflexota bacterium]